MIDVVPPNSSVRTIAIGAVIDFESKEVPNLFSILNNCTNKTITVALAITPATMPNKTPIIFFLNTFIYLYKTAKQTAVGVKKYEIYLAPILYVP